MQINTVISGSGERKSRAAGRWSGHSREGAAEGEESRLGAVFPMMRQEQLQKSLSRPLPDRWDTEAKKACPSPHRQVVTELGPSAPHARSAREGQEVLGKNVLGTGQR